MDRLIHPFDRGTVLQYRPPVGYRLLLALEFHEPPDKSARRETDYAKAALLNELSHHDHHDPILRLIIHV